MWTTATLHDSLTASGALRALCSRILNAIPHSMAPTPDSNTNARVCLMIRVFYKLIHRASVTGSAINGAFGLIVVEDDAMSVPQVPQPSTYARFVFVVHSFQKTLDRCALNPCRI